MRNLKKLLQHCRAVEAFESDFDAMKWADVCILLLPSGRSAHVEAGYMAGAGKTVIVVTQDGQGPELMYAVFGYIVSEPGALCRILEILNKKKVN